MFTGLFTTSWTLVEAMVKELHNNNGMDYIHNLNKLITNLEKSSKVSIHDSENEKESVRLAHALIDMLESFKEISENLSIKLMSTNITEEEVEETLFDIGQQLRHIIYHIKDPKFYEYIT